MSFILWCIMKRININKKTNNNCDIFLFQIIIGVDNNFIDSNNTFYNKYNLDDLNNIISLDSYLLSKTNFWIKENDYLMLCLFNKNGHNLYIKSTEKRNIYSVYSKNYYIAIEQKILKRK